MLPREPLRSRGIQASFEATATIPGIAHKVGQIGSLRRKTMMTMPVTQKDIAQLSDVDLAKRVSQRDPRAVRLMTERNNQRLFRAAWSVLGNRAEAEDAVQACYLLALKAIGDFEGRSSLSTWLTRIVINEALGRERVAQRRRARLDAESVVDLEEYREKLMGGSIDRAGPDGNLAVKQIRARLEAAIGELPPEFRLVFVMREVEGATIEEIANATGVSAPTVKTRLFRARRRLREALAPDLQASLIGAFPFAGADCEALTQRVMIQIFD
ncbi:RNA polymerase sigma factor [Novosphingobium sp. G106]|uniref:RNA polymerase sigma factor n=1 Tax=Novosphingobium sp. G106 TaxID=2849500 RepID=UPI0020C59FB3|nr:RNA polymerase sigma factor [Novosphingobium sp. G106]